MVIYKQLTLKHTFEVHQKYIKNFSNKGREILFAFSSLHILSDRKASQLFSDSGTKAAPLLSPGNRGFITLFIFYRNVSAALFLLNKVYNSIYSSCIEYRSTYRAPALLRMGSDSKAK
jgi:hypothetical protein